MAPARRSSVVNPQGFFFLVLLIVVVLSAVAVSYAKFESRKLFGELEKLRVQANEVAVTYGRLQIELATWAEPGRIEKKAKDDLAMKIPDLDQIVVLRP